MAFLSTNDVSAQDSMRDAELRRQEMMAQMLRAQQAQQQQRRQGGGSGFNPMTLLKGEKGPVSEGLGGDIGQMFGGPGSDFMQFGGTDAGSSAALVNPVTAALAAAVAGTAGLQHNNVSSVPHVLKGQWADDILNSPNVKNHVGDVIGEGGEKVARAGAQPFADMIAPSKWKDLPGDLWHGVKEPFNYFKGLFS